MEYTVSAVLIVHKHNIEATLLLSQGKHDRKPELFCVFIPSGRRKCMKRNYYTWKNAQVDYLMQESPIGDSS